MEPLRVLREFTIAGQLPEVVIDGDQIVFGSRSFPRDTQTAWRTKDRYYSLESLLHFVRHMDSHSVTDYMRLPRAPGVAIVSFLDRKGVEEYMRGLTDTDPAIHAELLLPQGAAGLTSQGEPSGKKVRLDHTQAGADRSQGQGGLLSRLLSCERSLHDRNSQLCVPDKNFKRVLDLLAITQREAQRKGSHAQASRSDKPHSASAHHSKPGSSSHRHRRPDGSHRRSAEQVAKSKPPIIIVPSAATAKINIFNAKTILEDGTYVTPDQARAQGAKRQPLVIFNRRWGRTQPVMYHITDQPPAVKSYDWKRVAAIFVTGAAWQFKDYPFKAAAQGDTVDTFTHCLGIYLGFKDEVMPETVRKWNVKRFELQRNDRHRDRAIVQDIFTAIDNFLGGSLKRNELSAY